MELLRLRQATRISDPGTRLIDGVTLSLQSGQGVALTGPSGSGKSVLLRALSGLDRLDLGSLEWRSKEVSRENITVLRSRCIYLHQRAWLLSGTVEESLREPFSLAIHQQRKYDQLRIIDWLQRLGRDRDFLAKSTERLSGGEMQLTALMRAVQLEPEVLLLDEPTSGLDEAATQWIENLVLDWLLADDRRAFVWASHDAEQLKRVANATWHIDSGRLVGAQA